MYFPSLPFFKLIKLDVFCENNPSLEPNPEKNTQITNHTPHPRWKTWILFFCFLRLENRKKNEILYSFNPITCGVKNNLFENLKKICSVYVMNVVWRRALNLLDFVELFSNIFKRFSFWNCMRVKIHQAWLFFQEGKNVASLLVFDKYTQEIEASFFRKFCDKFLFSYPFSSRFFAHKNV